MTKRLLLLLKIILVCACVSANPSFRESVSQNGDDLLVITFKADKVEDGLHVNGSFTLENLQGLKPLGQLHKVNDGLFRQTLRITAPEYSYKGYFQFIVCDDIECFAPEYVEVSRSGKVKPKSQEKPKADVAETKTKPEELAARKDSAKEQIVAAQKLPEAKTVAQQTGKVAEAIAGALDKDGGNEDGSIFDGGVTGAFMVFLLGFIGGILALLTPCVWPIIPLTVSFFLKREKGLRDASFFGISIVSLFLVLGVLVTILFGVNAMNALSTNAVFNVTCAVVLVLLGLSLMGFFELSLPSSWGNALDGKAEKATGFVSIFFMALTLVVVSFSCTAPVLGLIIAQISTDSSLFAPILGLFGFSLAIAFPFTLFALFPQWLKHLPRSGSWMNCIKVSLGVFELAFSLKFFSVADQSYGWNLLSPTLFLIIWALLFLALAVYIIVTMHRSKIVIFAVFPLFIGIYCVQGIFTGNTSMLSAFLPMEMTARKGLHATDYDEGLKIAKEHDKRIFLDFTGYGCVNCRKMEGAVFTDPRVSDVLQHEFVVVELFVDDKTPLPAQQTVTVDGKERILRTVGDKWSLFEMQRFHSASQPLYVILSPDGEQLSTTYAYDEDVEKFLKFLGK